MKFKTSLILLRHAASHLSKQWRKRPLLMSENINSYLQHMIERQEIPGLTLAVTRNDTVIYTGAFGVGNIDTREPMKLGHNFHWASVSGHVWEGKPIVSKVYPYNKIHAPSSTLNSNVEEMTHYAMANLQHAKYKNVRILKGSSYDLLWKNSVNLKDKPAVGMSWFLGIHNGLQTVAHSGGDTGFSSYLLLVPRKNISIMVACNYDRCKTDDIVYGVLDRLLKMNQPEEK
jgi:CubicO group peptidase (beta-lactamase class C family)